MNVLNLRPVGWDGMTPRQWYILREMIRLVSDTAFRRNDFGLFTRAQNFLRSTRGRDV